MTNSIDEIWKKGFLEEQRLVAPKVNSLYNQKSIHLVARFRRAFRRQLLALLILAIIFPFGGYLLGVLWQGLATSGLLLISFLYSSKQLQGVKKLDPGMSSYEYLGCFNQWLQDVCMKSGKIMRFSYPLYFLIAISIIWTIWRAQEDVVTATYQKFEGGVFLWDVPLIVVIIAGVITLLVFLFSEKIYRWDLRLAYGPLFDKIEKTIADMAMLKQDDHGRDIN